MRQATLKAPDLMLLVGTRVALGVGIGLLAATRLNERVRKGAGLALLAVGALTTIPILLNVRASTREVLASGGAVHNRAGTGPRGEHRGGAKFREAPMPL